MTIASPETFVLSENIDPARIKAQVGAALAELAAAAAHRADYAYDLFVLGCSTSEIAGGVIGKQSVPRLGELVVSAVMDWFAAAYREKKYFLAVQCCEHLNRALVVERACCEQLGFERVCVIPQPKAGGSAAAAAYRMFREPVMVENIRSLANLGLDIGGTMIGMHMRPVAVPVHLQAAQVGSAHVMAAYSRYKYVGGARAVYEE